MKSEVIEKTRTHVLRLVPDEDLEESILSYCKERHIKKAYVPLLQGGLKRCKLVSMEKSENPDRPKDIEVEINEPLEFYGQGIICPDEEGKLTLHVHLSGAKSDKSMIGGHFVKGEVVFHAECVIVELKDSSMTRKRDKDVFDFPLLFFGE